MANYFTLGDQNNRQYQVKDTSGTIITEGFFYVGAEVTLHGHCFRITSADDKTLRLMEERAANDFGFSDPVHAAEIFGSWVDGRVSELRAFLQGKDIKVGASTQ